jgi:hypothetical protein
MLILNRRIGEAVDFIDRESGRTLACITVKDVILKRNIVRFSYSAQKSGKGSGILYHQAKGEDETIALIDFVTEEIVATVMVMDIVPDTHAGRGSYVVRIGFRAGPAIQIVRDNAIKRDTTHAS